MLKAGWMAGLALLAALACTAPPPTPIAMTIQEYAAFYCGEGVLETVATPGADALGRSRAYVMSLERIEPPPELREVHEASLAFERALMRQYESDATATAGRRHRGLTQEVLDAYGPLREVLQTIEADTDLMEAWDEGCPRSRP